ncbi:hypothetical protein hamaS1_23970 [Moorella sp. Hama-1]|nr:hypothetical protein hamaS1_23970 [Moorella sp. Hama-1]
MAAPGWPGCRFLDATGGTQGLILDKVMQVQAEIAAVTRVFLN